MWNMGRTDQAQRLFRHALESNPYDGRPHNNLGVIDLEAGALEEALGHFEVARRLAPGDPGPALNVGVALLRMVSVVAGARDGVSWGWGWGWGRSWGRGSS